MRKLALVLGGSALAAGLLYAQPLTDPWWRPLNPGGGSAGVTYGTQLPSLATTGTNPGQGELAIDLDGGPFGRPQLNIWDHVTGVWRNVMIGSSGGTPQTIPVWNAAGTDLVDSIVTNVGDTIILTQTAGTFFIPDYLQLVAPFVSLGGVIPDLPNCAWADSNQIIFEGVTADAFEGILQAADFLGGADVTLTMANPVAGASGNILALATTVAAMDGNDTVSGLNIALTNANHGGANNFFYGVNIAAIVEDAQATESALNIASGWDRGVDFSAWAAGSDAIYLADNADIRWAANGRMQIGNSGSYSFTDDDANVLFRISHVAAATTGNLVDLTRTLAAMDGNDTVRGLFIDLTNADHGGANNLLYGINIDTIVGDPQATEAAVNIGAGWDNAITIASTAVPQILFTGAAPGRFGLPDTQSYIFDINNVAEFQIAQNAFAVFTGTDIAVVGAAQNIAPTSNVVEISAAAAASVATIAAPTNNVAAVHTFICANTNVTFTDAGAAGAANTLDLAGNFVCSQDDVLVVVFSATPGAGNARWVEVSRSVN